jgi:hypothetical protein
MCVLVVATASPGFFSTFSISIWLLASLGLLFHACSCTLAFARSTKVNGLFEAANDLFDEMEHQYRLRQYPIVSKMVNALPTVSTIGFVVAVLINLLLLVSVRVSPSGSLDVVPSPGSGFVDVANETIASLCTAAGNVTGASVPPTPLCFLHMITCVCVRSNASQASRL